MYLEYSEQLVYHRNSNYLDKLISRVKKALHDAELMYRVEGDENSLKTLRDLRSIHDALVQLRSDRLMPPKVTKVIYVEDFKQLDLDLSSL